MGMQDRDYYRKWWADKEREAEAVYLPKKKFTQPVYFENWHPVLTTLATVAICGVTYLVFLLIAHFFHIKT